MPPLTAAALELILQFAASLPCALIAVGPKVRRFTERVRSDSTAASTLGLTIQRVPATLAREQGLCLAPPPGAKEVLLVICLPTAGLEQVHAALEGAMWWVDRSLDEEMASTEGFVDASASPLYACVHIVDFGMETLMLYSSDDSPMSAGETASPRQRLRMPRYPFALHLRKLAELRHVQVSLSVRRLIVEVDARGCRRWLQPDVNFLLYALHAPLRAVQVPACSVSPVTLLNRFHASLRVLYLERPPVHYRDANRSGMLAPFSYDDEEYEEEESGTSPWLSAATVAAAADGASTPVAPRLTLLPPTAATASGKSPAQPRRAARPRLSLDGTPVLEELYVSYSNRHSLPQWVARCRKLKILILRNCAYDRLDALRSARHLQRVSLEGCAHFAAFEIFCGFARLQSLTVKNCIQLRHTRWLSGMQGSLRHLCIHHLSNLSHAGMTPTAASASSFTGAELNGLERLQLSVPNLRALRPFIGFSAATLRELSLITCINVNGFADLPALPCLEKVVITGNQHVQNFLWLGNSPRVREVRATQCTRLISLTGLDGLGALSLLDVSGAPLLRAIDAVAQCTALTYVDVSQCSMLSRVSVLARLPRLQVVRLRGCVRLAKEFGWVEGCPELREMMVPGEAWTGPAQRALKRYSRTRVTLF